VLLRNQKTSPTSTLSDPGGKEKELLLHRIKKRKEEREREKTKSVWKEMGEYREGHP